MMDTTTESCWTETCHYTQAH